MSPIIPRGLIGLVSALLIGIASNAQAGAYLDYTYTSDSNGSANWYMAVNPTVDLATTNAGLDVYSYVFVADGTASFNGQTSSFTEVRLADTTNGYDHLHENFFGIDSVGLYDNYENYGGVTYTDLFSGSTTGPTFLTGTWAPDSHSGVGTLTVTAVDAIPAVPEPASLGVLGLAIAGLAAARRRLI